MAEGHQSATPALYVSAIQIGSFGIAVVIVEVYDWGKPKEK
jgi:hypothetical protein